MWWNIIIGILLMIGGLSGQFVLRGTGSSAALVVFGGLIALWGAYRVFQKKSNRKKAMNNPVLQEPFVAAFYSDTLNAWGSGKLDYLSSSFKNGAGKLDYKGLIAAIPPAPGSALDVFFRKCKPYPGEFLIGVGNDSFGTGWFILTNIRLIQKDGRRRAFREVTLERVQGYTTRGNVSKVLTFVLKTGEKIVFEKVNIYPGIDYIKKIVSQAGIAQPEQIPQ